MSRKPRPETHRKLHPSAHGGELRNRRAGRGRRPISVLHSMHLVLRSTLARGAYSFATDANRDLIQYILSKHAVKNSVKILGLGNAGNHLHIRLTVMSRKKYLSFIRAVTGEIALKIKTHIRKKLGATASIRKNFWDRRPFSSIVGTARYAANLTDYIKINALEGSGISRAFAKLVVKKWRDGIWKEFG